MSRRLLLCLFLVLSCVAELAATHLRAGNITAVRISETSFRYRFTLVIYRDTESGVQVGNGTFNFGDGRIVAGIQAMTNASVEGFRETALANFTSVVVVEFDHTFQNEGDFIVSYTEGNRNQNIINLGGGASGTLPFHIETFMRISSRFSNNTPQLTVPPLDRACIGSQFFHNSGAFDIDGDSLAYRIVTPQQGRNIDANFYLPVNDATVSNLREDGGSPARFEIDPFDGTLVWDAAQFVGEYSIAFIVEEWRKSEVTGEAELIGYVTRDMQIIAVTCNNDRPELILPADTCISALSEIQAIITARDINNDKVFIEAFGGSFEVNTSPASFLALPDLVDDRSFRDQPAQSLFTWQTSLSHIRDQPYEVVFKVTDRPADRSQNPLTDFKTLSITVVAPAPTGLTGNIASPDGIQLDWDNYFAAALNPVMQVYRRIDSFDFNPINCNVGIPANSGYQLIDEISIDQTNYLDNNNVMSGVNYCYRLVAKFPLPNGGTSYASQEFCLKNNADVPNMINVSVEETDQTAGEVYTRWTSPLDINELLFPSPYRYELFRQNGLNGTGDRTLVASTFDTVLIDAGLNTQDQAYNYYVRFYDADDNLIDSADVASTPRLTGTPDIRAVDLSWETNVPWSNAIQTSPYHYIYRNRTDLGAQDDNNFVLIDSVNVLTSGQRYTDNGRFNTTPLDRDLIYCYYITTQGSYGNSAIVSPLLNNSQIICIQPEDDRPPEEPEIELPDNIITIEGPDGTMLNIIDSPNCELDKLSPCEQLEFSNTVNWTVNNLDDVDFFNVYFSSTGEEESYNLVGTSTTTEFIHSGLLEIKGCYKITSVDMSGNESEMTNSICFDNCPYYELPNTFTPNGDSINDTFRAFDLNDGRCSRFVEAVEFKVFNRWGGKEIYGYNSSKAAIPNTFIDWNGRDKDGKLLSPGTYYYTATVTFSTFDPAKRKQEFKNWVKIVK
ncbi:gliding motility-associated C-terminal domain-containing protein [Roseivirga sp.]|uniref:T9SS type B sorting domain-containing protein n=1 Tax=Roseivirga sp. TaxID=1964215 RepID=UPI003B8D1FD4